MAANKRAQIEIDGMDIVSELYKRGMYDALEIIVGNLPFQSLLKMHYVSKDWLQLMKEIHVWKIVLRHRYRSCPDYKKTCDLAGWTKYILEGVEEWTPDHCCIIQRIKFFFVNSHVTNSNVWH